MAQQNNICHSKYASVQMTHKNNISHLISIVNSMQWIMTSQILLIQRQNIKWLNTLDNFVQRQPAKDMGCSDVSEFQHIYGQISTTPSCVYGPLFTWTRMVVVNALIVWKKSWYSFVFWQSKVFWHWQLPIRNSEEWLVRWYEANIVNDSVFRRDDVDVK